MFARLPLLEDSNHLICLFFVLFFLRQEEPKKVFFNYDLFLNLEGNPPVNHLRCEKLTFNNPTQEFRRKLIKAGGVRLPLCIVAGPKKRKAQKTHNTSDLCSVVCRAVAVAFPYLLPCPAQSGIPTTLLVFRRSPGSQFRSLAFAEASPPDKRHGFWKWVKCGNFEVLADINRQSLVCKTKQTGQRPDFYYEAINTTLPHTKKPTNSKTH